MEVLRFTLLSSSGKHGINNNTIHIRLHINFELWISHTGQ